MKRFFFDLISPLNTPVLFVLIGFIIHACLAKDITGDLGRIGQIVFSKKYHTQSKFEEHIDKHLYWCSTNELKSFDMVFMGDSFTESVYPYYLSHNVEKNTALYKASEIVSSEQIFVALCNSGVVMPHVVVLEDVERSFIERLGNLDFNPANNSTLPIGLVYKPKNEKTTDFATFYKNQLIDNHSVRHVRLKDSLFSCPKKEKDLYFYYEDLRFPVDAQIQTAMSKLDTLFQIANKNNVQLFYVVASDKYDVYQEFAIDNKYPKKDWMDSFSKFEANPYFVNTKHVLLKNARQGVKDLYYADDTHWSPVGAKMVAEEIAKRMDSLGVFHN